METVCLAIPGRIEELDGQASALPTGSVSFGGIRRSINLAFVPGARVGDYVIVHAGFAISVLDEDEARRALDLVAAAASAR